MCVARKSQFAVAPMNSSSFVDECENISDLNCLVLIESHHHLINTQISSLWNYFRIIVFL